MFFEIPNCANPIFTEDSIQSILEIFNGTQYDSLKDNKFYIIGRILSFRPMGGVAFGHIIDQSHSSMQFALHKKNLENNFKEFVSHCNLGNWIGIDATLSKTNRGEPTLMVHNLTKLGECTIPFPDKYHGVKDCRDRKWLGSAISNDFRKNFVLRHKIIKEIENFLDAQDFISVDTPVLCSNASGAQAKTFETYSNALSKNLHLRISPETYLKRWVCAGFSRVYEIGKQFRNEGESPAHMPEFTSLEWYGANLDYKDNLVLFKHLCLHLHSKIKFESDFFLDIAQAPMVSYSSLFNGPISDEIFKKEIRPNLLKPVFLIDYPDHMCPLSYREDGIAHQWQLIYNGWELVKCYTELTDAIEQRSILEDQIQNKEGVAIEKDFLDAMEFGMPKMSGLGIGIDRFIASALGIDNIRDIVFFSEV
jgi:lysyl-tRNA synthetase class 2